MASTLNEYNIDLKKRPLELIYKKRSEVNRNQDNFLMASIFDNFLPT